MEESFEAFMRRALFDPKRGYYSRQVTGIGGRRGDFATSATLSEDLGRSVARWLKESCRTRPIRQVIEVGAGDGRLMEAVRRELGWWVRRCLRFHIVEVSEPLRAEQQKRLRGASVVWHKDMGSALEAAGGEAWIYHNELLDAFPCRRLEWREGRWNEVWVRSEAGRVTGEFLKPLAEEQQAMWAEGSTVLQRWGAATPPVEGQRVEIHLAVKDWMEQWAPHWKAGEMLTVDYGAAFPAVYHRRPGGTLRAYLLQHRLEGAAVYDNVGRQDLTADINFSDCTMWAAERGWEPVTDENQADWLRRWGLGDSVMAEEAGVGGAFRCVVCRVG